MSSKCTKGTPFKNNGGDIRGSTDAHANRECTGNNSKAVKRKKGWDGRKFVASADTGAGE